MTHVDLVGRRFGLLVVVQRNGHAPNGKSSSAAAWLCRCDCGSEKTISGATLRKGAVRSCGCLLNKYRKGPRSHGKTGSAEFRAYYAMRNRCLNPKNKEYARYGGSGIRVCDRWLNGDDTKSGIECFLLDMGSKPTDRHSLDRINGRRGYSPENCRWASTSQQVRNRSNTIVADGVDLATLAERHGLNYYTVFSRWKSGKRGPDLVAPPRARRKGGERMKLIVKAHRSGK